MSKLPTPSNNTHHHSCRSENWAPAYIFIGVIPVAFVVAAVASVLLRHWQKKRRAAGGRPREDGQQPQDIELAQLARLRRHWFPWREALQEVQGGNLPSSSSAPDAVTVDQFTQQKVSGERPRSMGVNPRLANKLAAKFEGRGGVWGSSAVEPTVAGPSRSHDDDVDTRSSVTQWPRPGLTLESAKKSESAPGPKPKPRDRVPHSHSYCHGYGIRRESDEDKERYAELDRERNDEMNHSQTEGNHIQTEGMAEVDLADGIDQEERERQENERQRAIWWERIKGLTRDDDLLPLVRQDAKESKGRSPGRKIAKVFGFGRG